MARDVSLLGAVGIGLGAIIGAGIYVVTGVAAGIAGPAFVVGLGLAGVVATANALSSAQLAARIPRSGGTYEYGYELLGPGWGFTAGWMFLSGKLTAAGTVAMGLAGYVSALVPSVDPRAVAVGAVLVFTLLNYFGIRRSNAANLAIVAATVAALVAFAAWGAPAFDTSNLTPFWPDEPRRVLEAAAILFFAFTGYARIATLGEEVRDPERTIPRAIAITIASAIVLYAAVALVAVGAVGAGALSDTAA
ncbi:MAG: amino acid permease, partial [Gemmatimonadota bacterium]|nr:amino acid permease [Gemmatimonadota bacterium]